MFLDFNHNGNDYPSQESFLLSKNMTRLIWHSQTLLPLTVKQEASFRGSDKS